MASKKKASKKKVSKKKVSKKKTSKKVELKLSDPQKKMLRATGSTFGPADPKKAKTAQALIDRGLAQTNAKGDKLKTTAAGREGVNREDLSRGTRIEKSEHAPPVQELKG